MENPATHSEQTAPAREESRTGVFLHAIFSAAVFGAIGAWLGNTLGKYGNGKDRDMAQPIMKWSMGAFWALVAAYCSLKADERTPQATPENEARTSHAAPPAKAPMAKADSTIHAASAEHQGEAVAGQGHARA